MTLTEALSEGLMTTFVGLLIVFAVLIILMLVMMLMKVVFYKPEAKPAEKAEPAAPVAAAAETESNATDEAELIAVLTAAVAVCMDKPASKLNIKSYKRIKNTAPAWNKAGVRDVIEARF